MRRVVPAAAALWIGIGASATAAPAPPRGLAGLPARAMVLIAQGSGKVLFAEHANDELPIASTTKLMTALVTVEREQLGQTLVEQPYTAGVGESLAGVPAGGRLPLADMLRAMLLPSGNNVAYSLAVDVGGSVTRFVSMMNELAALLSLGRTHFTTPIGLDTPGDNYSTATDLARLARVVLRDPLVAKIVDQPSARLADGVVVRNRNDLVGAYRWVVGVKTGSTQDAGQCLVAAASLNGVRLISVVLGAPSEAARDADTLALLRYGLSLFRSVPVAVAGRVYASVPVTGRARRARLIARRSLRVVIARSVRLHVSLNIGPAHLVGPLRAGTVEGAIRVHENGRVVKTVALVTAAAVPAPRPVVQQGALGWIAAGGGGLTVIVLGCSLPLMRRRAMRSAPGVL
jgi:serine-type D-Ala-D-Ala carboxypeptidase (penicillin-binding protein 5/6)